MVIIGVFRCWLLATGMSWKIICSTNSSLLLMCVELLGPTRTERAEPAENITLPALRLNMQIK